MLQAKDIRRKDKKFCAQTLFIVQIYVQKCSLMVLRADSTLPLCVNEQTCNLCMFVQFFKHVAFRHNSTCTICAKNSQKRRIPALRIDGFKLTWSVAFTRCNVCVV